MVFNNDIYGNFNDLHQWNQANTISDVSFSGITSADKNLNINDEYETKEHGNQHSPAFLLYLYLTS